MCGIIGYNGGADAAPLLLEGLRRLEYRGYDSAGAAVPWGGGFQLRRAVGRLTELARVLARHPLPHGGVGIAHTRWATHGGPTAANAHPHLHRRVALVHNGIIENYHELSEQLIARGHTFESETDTEVIAHLLDEAYLGDPTAAIGAVLPLLRGSYALAILFADRPEELYGVRLGSPLHVGLGQEECYLTSDPLAVLHRTRRFISLPEGEIACLGRDGARFCLPDGTPVTHVPRREEEAYDPGSCAPYKTYMEKEMAEQPEAVRRTLAPYLTGQTPFGTLFPHGTEIRRILFTACGSALHACLCGGRWIEELAGIPCEAHVASELRYGTHPIESGTLAIALSQSGETADTIAAVRRLQREGVPTVGVINVPSSTLAEEVALPLRTHAGPEIAVATTKAYSAQVALLGAMACRLARERGRADPRAEAALRRLPSAMERVTERDGDCRRIAARLKEWEHVFFIGRGRDLDACHEGSLKLKEISYVHSEAYAAGELKHGTISLIRSGLPVIAVMTDGALREKTLNGAKECRARGAHVTVLYSEDLTPPPADACDDSVAIPGGVGIFSSLPAVAVMQRIAYHTAALLSRDVDKPRNLAKSVTVE